MSGVSRFISLLLLLFAISAQAKNKPEPKFGLFDLPKAYREGKFSFFPIPIFEADPGSGERYGLMPTFILKNKKEEILSIFVAAYTYNTLVQSGGYVGAYLYPSSEEKLRLFLRASQNFERDYYIQYENLRGRFDIDSELEYFRNPFERFFGFGPDTTKSTQSNFVSSVWTWRERGAYEFIPHFFAQVEEKILRLGLGTKAINSLNDTKTYFAGSREVGDFNQWIHRFSLIWDTRNDPQFFTRGHFLESYFLASHQTFGGDRFYDGYGLLAKKALTCGDRFTTVGFFRLEELFGETIPFYLQNNLGGEKDLRGFVERRFVGNGRILLDLEERIRIVHVNVLGAVLDFSIDPFFSVGQVFDDWSQVRFSKLQPVGGIGFRGLAPPSVVGRVDIGLGKEGIEIFTTLDYPF